jgi:hypothetical protein|tara:strand:- start:428 stop:610 length:183 start_codon:yes stop_codon:yes gene_type:complete
MPMSNKAKEVYGNKPKLNRRTKRKIKRQIDKDIKSGKYDYLKDDISNNNKGLKVDSNYNG